MPKFRDSDHPVKTSADAEAYLSRLNAFPGVLDGENERLKAAGGQGLIAPAFLIDKAVTAMEATIADAKAGGSMVESLVRRPGEANIAGDWSARRSEEHTSELQSLMRLSYAVLCFKKKNTAKTKQ